MRRHFTLLAVAVHLREEGGIAEPARIGIDGRRLFERRRADTGCETDR